MREGGDERHDEDRCVVENDATGGSGPLALIPALHLGPLALLIGRELLEGADFRRALTSEER
jgi:hypothetical protein